MQSYRIQSKVQAFLLCDSYLYSLTAIEGLVTQIQPWTGDALDFEPFIKLNCNYVKQSRGHWMDRPLPPKAGGTPHRGGDVSPEVLFADINDIACVSKVAGFRGILEIRVKW